MAIRFRLAVFSIQELLDYSQFPRNFPHDMRFEFFVFRRLIPKMWVSHLFGLGDFGGKSSLSGVVIVSGIKHYNQFFLEPAVQKIRDAGYDGEILALMPPQGEFKLPDLGNFQALASDDITEITNFIRDRCMIVS